MLTSFYEPLGADKACADVSHLLRLPGFSNHKYDPPRPCSIISYDAAKTYPLRTFNKWFEVASAKKHKEKPATLPPLSHGSDVPQYALQLADELDQEVADRSTRDFFIMCSLVRLGLDDQQIQSLVSGRSKFVREDYLKRTVANARRAVAKQA